jgi:hypothetical protein
MKNLMGLFFGILMFQIVLAQEPQFSVVRPDGTTSIFSSWDLAYNNAQNGDVIFLPGINIYSSQIILIEKEIKIIGVGHNPDSSITSGITEISGYIQINSPNVELYNLRIIDVRQSHTASSMKIINCNIQTLIFNANNNLVANSIISFIGMPSNNCGPINSVFRNCIINIITGIWNNTFNNCIFLNLKFSGIHYCTFYNSIFLFQIEGTNSSPCGSNNNRFFNSAFPSYSIPLADPLSANNYFTVSPDMLFAEPPSDIGNFSYKSNFRLKANSPYLTAANDGGQIGVFGGQFPWQNGRVMSNPFIYDKKVAPYSTSDGKLKVEYKVRTGN